MRHSLRIRTCHSKYVYNTSIGIVPLSQDGKPRTSAQVQPYHLIRVIPRSCDVYVATYLRYEWATGEREAGDDHLDEHVVFHKSCSRLWKAKQKMRRNALSSIQFALRFTGAFHHDDTREIGPQAGVSCCLGMIPNHTPPCQLHAEVPLCRA